MPSSYTFHLARFLLLPLLLFCFLSVSFVYAESKNEKSTQKAIFKIAEPYIDIHTGPGRGYPITYVATKGQLIQVERQRTQWFQVSLFIREGKVKQGWVSQSQLAKTLTPKGQPITLNRSTKEDYLSRTWEVGFLGGRFDGISTNSVYVGYAFSQNFSTEVWMEDILGDFASAKMASLNIIHHPFPEWRVSPFFSLGVGAIKTKNKNRLLRNTDSNDDILNVGLGVKTYVSQRFLFRAEYKNYVLLTSRDENEEPEAWKLGFSLFF